VTGPGAQLARELLGKLTDHEREILHRWASASHDKRDFITAFFAGRFLVSEGIAMVALSNAARAIADCELPESGL
jgi:hypothetical protein